mmetsp:Transcript_17967/g.30060  ORF Transcript_17967/g.30060 Transcript_17967/m.30060 type:complete len:463 (-) Transcript_17967:36-1424(-)
MLARTNNVKVLIVGYVWPELTSSAAGLRDWNLVKGFQKQNWKVLYSSQSKENQFSEQLRNEGVTTVRHAANCSRFDDFIKNEQPDFVIYDRYVTEEQFGWRVKEYSPSSVQILDTQDLHFLRKQRQKAHEDGVESLESISKGEIELIGETTLRELASIYRCDCSILISDFEFQLLTNKFKVPSSMLHIGRLSYDPAEEFRSYEKRTRDFCMIGNFRHAPNYDATFWLKEKIWPLIRARLPTAEVDIYGAYPPKEVMKLSSAKEGFHVRGPVKDHINMLKKYRINLAPLRYGAGIKGKVSDGWYCGTPAVSTPIGAEGMTDCFPFGGVVSSLLSPRGSASSTQIFQRTVKEGTDFCAESFAAEAVSLYLDEKTWTECQRRGGTILSTLYSHDINTRALVNRMLHTKDNLDQIRKSNLMGSILNYQLNRGTKYFSQWIEEKNKNKAKSKGNIRSGESSNAASDD